MARNKKVKICKGDLYNYKMLIMLNNLRNFTYLICDNQLVVSQFIFLTLTLIGIVNYA